LEKSTKHPGDGVGCDVPSKGDSRGFGDSGDETQPPPVPPNAMASSTPAVVRLITAVGDVVGDASGDTTGDVTECSKCALPSSKSV
jgi:hypothetical protein